MQNPGAGGGCPRRWRLWCPVPPSLPCRGPPCPWPDRSLATGSVLSRLSLSYVRRGRPPSVPHVRCDTAATAAAGYLTCCGLSLPVPHPSRPCPFSPAVNLHTPSSQACIRCPPGPVPGSAVKLFQLTAAACFVSPPAKFPSCFVINKPAVLASTSSYPSHIITSRIFAQPFAALCLFQFIPFFFLFTSLSLAPHLAHPPPPS